MLNKLCGIKTVDGLTAFGLEMLAEGSGASLQNAIREQSIIFSPSDYWSDGVVWQLSHNPADLNHTLESSYGDTTAVNVLHRLQLLKVVCPAVTTKVARLLKKATY